MAVRAKRSYPYEPDYAIVPGRTLLEKMEELGMNQRALSTRLELSPKCVNQIIHGKAPITHETAIRLERVTGIPARIWNNLEMNYRERLAQTNDQMQLVRDLNWLKTIPTKELIARGKVAQQPDKPSFLRAVLAFFGVSSTEAWKGVWMKPEVAFRKSPCFSAKPGETATWLRLGELDAQGIHCSPFDKARFKKVLSRIRRLTTEDPELFQPKMIELCRQVGVALVLVPRIVGCPASSVTRWLAPNKALIQLSLRHKSDDHFWFSFFHEAGHILNDSKKAVFIDENNHEGNEREIRADRFAENYLIPPSEAAALHELRTGRAVTAFAKQIGIAPGIVVGRLQKEGTIEYSSPLNRLKRKFTWSTS